jgi:chorismate synthase
MLSINACKGFDYGRGFEGICERGSQQNDPFISTDDGTITTATNRSGGIQGGISNGQPIYLRAAFKPVATQLREQPTIDIHGNEQLLCAKGRHDPCVVPRAVPIVEAMAAITILDQYLLYKVAR